MAVAPPALPASAWALRATPIHALVAAGGFAALSWEVIWQRQASLAFGISALGTALTLAATMAGMAVGALFAGWWLRWRSIERPLRAYGLLELVIGLSGLLMLPGFSLLEFLDARVYAFAPTLAPILHGLGIAMLLAPPTCAMGATIPVFQLVARRHGTSVSALYGWNTAGAAAGVLLLTFALLPELGVARSVTVVASINFAVLAIALFARPRVTVSAHAAVAATGEEVARIGPRLALFVVLGTGFVTFGLEVTWFRAMRSAFWNTSATFAILLAAVLIPIAVGARLVPWMRRRQISPGTVLACAGAAILAATPLVERLDLVIYVTGPYTTVIAFWFAITLAIVSPALICLATALPWCLEEYPSPQASGRLYALNALGSVLGSLMAAWLLLPTLGFARSAWLLGLVVFGLALAVSGNRGRLLAASAAAVSLGLATLLTSSPGRDRLHGRKTFDSGRVLAFDEGPDFTTSVIEKRTGFRYLLIDGFVATSEKKQDVGHYMHWMGSLPALLHPKPERALVICFGTGRTANAVRREGVDRLDIVDVSSAVFDMARFFYRANEGVLEDRRVESIVMDGRAWLRRTRRRYDVITLEPMPPNFSGVNALYSREFYELAATRLTPGGVVAQWLPFHLLTPDHSASIAATFVAVFADSILWIDPRGGTGILLGRVAGAPKPLGASWPGLARRSAPRPLGEDQIRAGVFLSGETFDRYASQGAVITDDNQLLEFSRMRPGTRGRRQKSLFGQNYRVLNEVGGPLPLLDRSRRRPKSG